MAIAFVKQGGVAGNNAGPSSGTFTLSVTVPAGGHAAGNLVVLAGEVFGGPTPIGVTDSRGNVWNVIRTNVVNGTSFVYSSLLTTALLAGDTISYSATVTISSKMALASAEFSGLGRDVLGSLSGGFNASTQPSLGPIDVGAGALIFAEVGLAGPTSDTFTQDTDVVGGAWQTLTVGGTTGGGATSNVTVRTAYKITTSSASQTYNPTLGTLRPSDAQLHVLGARPGRIVKLNQAVQRASLWMKRDGISVPRLWTPAGPVGAS